MDIFQVEIKMLLFSDISACDIIDFDNDEAFSGADSDLILYWSVSETLWRRRKILGNLIEILVRSKDTTYHKTQDNTFVQVGWLGDREEFSQHKHSPLSRYQQPDCRKDFAVDLSLE